jgi:hypothetical protein
LGRVTIVSYENVAGRIDRDARRTLECRARRGSSVAAGSFNIWVAGERRYNLVRHFINRGIARDVHITGGIERDPNRNRSSGKGRDDPTRHLANPAGGAVGDVQVTRIDRDTYGGVERGACRRSAVAGEALDAVAHNNCQRSIGRDPRNYLVVWISNLQVSLRVNGNASPMQTILSYTYTRVANAR